MNKDYAYMILVIFAYLLGLYTYSFSHVCEQPVIKTTEQYNELWNSLQEVEANHKWEMAKKDISYFKKLGCTDIVINYLIGSRPVEAKFVSFSTVGNFEFIRLNVKGKVKNYDVEGVLDRTYKVDCRKK